MKTSIVSFHLKITNANPISLWLACWNSSGLFGSCSTVFLADQKRGPAVGWKKPSGMNNKWTSFLPEVIKIVFFGGVPLTSWNVENKTWYSQRSTNWKVPLWHKMYAQKTCSFNPSVHPMLMRIWGGNPPNATSPKKQGLIKGVINHHSSWMMLLEGSNLPNPKSILLLYFGHGRRQGCRAHHASHLHSGSPHQ